MSEILEVEEVLNIFNIKTLTEFDNILYYIFEKYNNLEFYIDHYKFISIYDSRNSCKNTEWSIKFINNNTNKTWKVPLSKFIYMLQISEKFKYKFEYLIFTKII